MNNIKNVLLSTAPIAVQGLNFYYAFGIKKRIDPNAKDSIVTIKIAIEYHLINDCGLYYLAPPSYIDQHIFETSCSIR